MKFTIMAIAGIIMFTACQDNQQGSATTSTTSTTSSTGQPEQTPQKENPAPAPSAGGYAGCYIMNIEKDTARMSLEATPAGYTGKLTYKRFEKDSNKGTVRLVEDDNYLKGWYTFQSEGMTSLREVIFKKKNGSLAEGYGDVKQSHDSVFYSFPTTLRYEENHLFTKTACEK